MFYGVNCTYQTVWYVQYNHKTYTLLGYLGYIRQYSAVVSGTDRGIADYPIN